MEKLLRENVDTIRNADGTYNMVVLEELSSRQMAFASNGEGLI